jgi:hypothetical protein
VSEASAQPPDLAPLALVQLQLEQRVLAAPMHQLDVHRSRAPLGQPDALAHALDRLVVRRTLDLDAVGLLDAEARVREQVAQLAVVGEDMALSLSTSGGRW